MISADRDALLCDMAETYGIYDLRALPVSTLATLAVGLRDDSRIKMHMHGAKISRIETLLAAAVDRLSMLWWAKTEDARSNANRPKSMPIADLLVPPQRDSKPRSGQEQRSRSRHPPRRNRSYRPLLRLLWRQNHNRWNLLQILCWKESGI